MISRGPFWPQTFFEHWNPSPTPTLICGQKSRNHISMGCVISPIMSFSHTESKSSRSPSPLPLVSKNCHAQVSSATLKFFHKDQLSLSANDLHHLCVKRLSLLTLHFHFLSYFLLMKPSLCSVSTHSHPLNSSHTCLSVSLIPHSIFLWLLFIMNVSAGFFVCVTVWCISWTIQFSLFIVYHTILLLCFLGKSLPFSILPVHCTCNTKAETRETVTLISFHTIFCFTKKTLIIPAIQQNNLILLIYYLKTWSDISQNNAEWKCISGSS